MKSNQGLKLWNKPLIQIIVIIGLMIIGFITDSPLDNLSLLQWRTFIILVISIFIWSTNVIPSGVSSLFIVSLIMIFGIVDSFSDAIKGFLSSAIYFVLIVSIISQVMVKIKLDKAIVHFISKYSGRNMLRTAIGLVITMMILPIFMPSAVSRLRMFVPLVNELNKSYKLLENSAFRRFSLWTIGGLNQFMTMLVLSGGGYPILASEMIGQLGYPLTWTTWILYMLPPTYMATIFTTIFMFFYFGLNKEYKQNRLSENQLTKLVLTEPHIIPTKDGVKQQDTPFLQNNKKEMWIVTVLILFMLLSWFLGSFIGIPAILPPIIVLVILSLPGLSLISNDEVRKYDWENFLLLGAAISLSTVVLDTGTAGWIANLLFNLIPNGMPSYVSLLQLILIVILLRFLFASPTAGITVILPLSVTAGISLGLSGTAVALITILIVGAFMVLPIHSPTMLLAFQTGIFSGKDQWIVGWILVIAVIISSIISNYVFW